MKTAILLAALFVASLMAGCATGDYGEYIKAQADANKLAGEQQKPLVRLTAQAGQPITGLASLEVYAPTAAPIIQQARPNEWAGVLGQGISVIGTVMGIHEAGKAAVGLSDSVGRAGTAGYQFVQTPAANISTITTTSTTSTVGDNSGSNSGNSGRIAGTSMSDATSTPTVVLQPVSP